MNSWNFQKKTPKNVKELISFNFSQDKIYRCTSEMIEIVRKNRISRKKDSSMGKSVIFYFSRQDFQQ